MQDAGVDKWVRALEKASDHAPTWISVRVPDAPAEAAPDTTPMAKVRKPGAAKKAAVPKAAAKKTSSVTAKKAVKKIVAKRATAGSATPRKSAKKNS
ncbi:Exodeoxyribonuclease III (fragment) [Xanthomonas citri pv. citri]|uniref:Exodeoxyribonuclease III n=1 Tax=Xanthomonas citri pv. citri TaxID=611301 RepID=A0A0U5FDD6_XANCI